MFFKKTFKANADTALKYACQYNINDKLPITSTVYGQIASDSATWVLKDLTTQKEYVLSLIHI